MGNPRRELGFVLVFLCLAFWLINVMQIILRLSSFELRLVFKSVLFGYSMWIGFYPIRLWNK